LEFLVRAVRQEEEIKDANRWGRSQTIPVCRWHDTICQRSEKLQQKLLDIINSYSKVAGYKINLQKSIAFLYTNSEHIEKEHRKIILFAAASINQNI
jgi:hypothetical protein